MLTAYIVTAILGGVLIVVSLFGGDHDHSVELDGDLGVEAGIDVAGGHSIDTDFDVWLPFFSLRFWTYLCLAFGATGLLFTLLTDMHAVPVAVVASSVGLLMGFGVSVALRWLQKSQTSSAVSERELLGVEARVLVPLKTGSSGKIRATLKGEMIDLLAITDEGQEIAAGEQVMIVDVENDRARVVRRSAFFGDDT